ncbi:NAD-dependent protein deacetylase [Halioglobus sp. HI00S01]|uniref:NAD-dependent protein deacetylase n=1 Tax=Halioglobus sp. HI00S01 TaxID=1822214 RepID=UPI000ACBE899|nr:NAD-dependent protein deacetylase [Halioglobus sp. HI00S01]
MTDSHDALAHFLAAHSNLLVLTGAGISAPSGLPTYRDENGSWLYRKPIQHRDFLARESTRKRYWARSTLGWPAVRDASPNEAHYALQRLEKKGQLELLVTQNVDRLHQRAGSRRVIDLHGRLDRVRCLDCGALASRESLQETLASANPWLSADSSEARPDGDRDLPDDTLARFEIPSCARCTGVLIPDVVFFGGSIPPARHDSCNAALDRADALLVVGSSLQVYSGYRFCRRAKELGLPLVIVNPGKTRADDLADMRIAQTAAEAFASVQV